MLFHLFHLLAQQDRVPGTNVFRYVSTRVGMATLTSLLITFFVAPWFIRRARERQLGEVIREDGPAVHWTRPGHRLVADAWLADYRRRGAPP
ncbi:MAG TPA: hypothetical protein VLT58_16025, partial [Polyangia bacterium]|nr:hypothetical protein [Polyangia bacterium]